MRRRELGLLGALLLAYLALGALFAARTPRWQAPDEPAHYNYVAQLVGGDLPVIEAGDWNQDYLSQVVGAEFDPVYPVDGLTYEDWQPPLYYLLQAPIYRLSGGSLLAMRLLSVALGAGVVALAYVAGREIFPGREWAALAVAAFVAFLPQHLAILSSVNNDSLAELLIAAILALLVTPWPDRPPPRRLLLLGVLLGAAFLTKATAYLMAPVAAAFLLARYWPRPVRSPARSHVTGLLRPALLAFVPALLLGLLWWGRNAAVYGVLDVMGKSAHDAVVVGQPRTAEWIAQYGLAGTIGRFLRTTFNSFWGQFGWMAAPLPDWMYAPLLLLTLAAVVGLILALMRPDTRRDTRYEIRNTEEDAATDHWPLTTEHSSLVSSSNDRSRHSSLVTLVLSLTFLLTLALHIGYNLTFVQHQGRYLFPALIPIAVGFTAGLGYWLRPLIRRRPWAGYLLPLGVALGLGGMASFALWRILPGLAPG